MNADLIWDVRRIIAHTIEYSALLDGSITDGLLCRRLIDNITQKSRDTDADGNVFLPFEAITVYTQQHPRRRRAGDSYAVNFLSVSNHESLIQQQPV